MSLLTVLWLCLFSVLEVRGGKGGGHHGGGHGGGGGGHHGGHGGDDGKGHHGGHGEGHHGGDGGGQNHGPHSSSDSSSGLASYESSSSDFASPDSASASSSYESADPEQNDDSIAEEGVFWSAEEWESFLPDFLSPDDHIPSEVLNNLDLIEDELWFGGDEDEIPHGENAAGFVIGGTLDDDGCLVAGGYTYCRGLSECLRTWEFEGNWDTECDGITEETSNSGFLYYFFDDEGNAKCWVWPTIILMAVITLFFACCIYVKCALLKRRQRSQMLLESAARMLAEGKGDKRIEFTRGKMPVCVACGASAVKSCERCHQEWYCSRNCQIAHWLSKHSKVCEPKSFETPV